MSRSDDLFSRPNNFLLLFRVSSSEIFKLGQTLAYLQRHLTLKSKILA
jgi:hypothetical protein